MWKGASWGWGESTSLALVGHPSRDGVTIKILYDRRFITSTSLTIPSFPNGLVKTESDVIVRSVETGWRRWTKVVAVISVDAYPLFLHCAA